MHTGRRNGEKVEEGRRATSKSGCAAESRPARAAVQNFLRRTQSGWGNKQALLLLWGVRPQLPGP